MTKNTGHRVGPRFSRLWVFIPLTGLPVSYEFYVSELVGMAREFGSQEKMTHVSSISRYLGQRHIGRKIGNCVYYKVSDVLERLAEDEGENWILNAKSQLDEILGFDSGETTSIEIKPSSRKVLLTALIGLGIITLCLGIIPGTSEDTAQYSQTINRLLYSEQEQQEGALFLSGVVPRI